METLATRSGKLVALDLEAELLTVDDPVRGTRVVIDLATDRIVVSTAGDLELNAGGRLRLTAGESIDLESKGTLNLVGQGDAALRGKVVRIN